MAENSIISIRNATIASVLAGILLMLIPVVRQYVAAAGEALWSALLWCWSALIDSYSAPGWLWMVISGFALVGATRTFLAIRGAKPQPEYMSYVEDILYGAKWRWQWRGSHLNGLWCFCPTCDAVLVYDDSSCNNIYKESKTDFVCENCHRVVASVEGGKMIYAVNAAEREILRRIRTGEYKNR
jgi:hypothetical protein